MLTKRLTKKSFLLLYLLLAAIQLTAAVNFQLFGDEAFYWLEGQYLAWSYSEVPGWTPWTLWAMDGLFPQHAFFIRIPSLLAALSIPWLGIHITRKLADESIDSWLTGLLLLTLPILGLAGILAVADIWVIFFTLIAFYILIQSIQRQQSKDFILLGLVLALGINAHIRFWLVVLITGAVVIWQFRSHKPIIKKLMLLTFPLMLLGLMPTLMFNFQHDFTLFSFQLKDRHPWEFQTSHFSFFLIQIVITTPWVFYLCLKNLKYSLNQTTSNSSFQQLLARTIICVAVFHWLVYATAGFFSDALRLNVHWTLVSYVLLLLITALNSQISSRLKKWAVVTGVLASSILLLTLTYWLLFQTPKSPTNIRITNHATGWNQLAQYTDELLRRENTQAILTDHFMTLAQLTFYSKQTLDIKTLPHPLNIKHGRAKQLKIMGLLSDKSQKPQILVVEHSALKLPEAIEFYQFACQQLNGIELLDSLDINYGLKTYYYFKTATKNSSCEIPPLLYYQHQNGELTGWVLQNINQTIELELYDSIKQIQLSNHIKTNLKVIGDNPLFKNLDLKQYQLLEFFIDDITDSDKTLQLKLKLPKKIIRSQRIILDD